jgi:cytochrome c
LRVLATAVTIIGILFRVPACFAEEDAFGPLQRDGLALAERMCAQCHAIGPIGASAHSSAPAFRDLDRRIDLDGFTGQLREGLVSGHPDMPTFRFSREDARALTAYLRTIQQ